MYVEMANNCFQKNILKSVHCIQCIEQSVCVWYRHCMHLVYIYTYCNLESPRCIVGLLSIRTCHNASKACRPCAVQHLPARLLQAAVIRFCSRQPHVDASVHGQDVVCAHHRRLDPLVELGDRCTSCCHDTLIANEACLRTLRPHFRVQALVGILCRTLEAATQQIRVAESHIHFLDMSGDIPCQWSSQVCRDGYLAPLPLPEPAGKNTSCCCQQDSVSGEGPSSVDAAWKKVAKTALRIASKSPGWPRIALP